MTINVGVIGLGFMGSAHVRVYSKLKNCRLVAICDKDPAKKDLAKTYNCNFHLDLDKFFTEKLDAVSVCTPTSLHKTVVLEALENGMHVLVEKPFAISFKDGKSMVDKAISHNKLVAIGYIERFNAAVSKLIESVDFSKIYSTVSMRFGPFPPRVIDSGVFLDLASHEIDLLNYLTKKQPEVLYAHFSKTSNSRFDDYAYISLKYGHIHSHIEVSWLPDYKLRLSHLYGNEKYYTVNYAQQRLTSFRSPPKAKIENGSWDDILWLSRHIEEQISVSSCEPLVLELQCFIDSVKKNQILEPLCNTKEALQVLKVTDCALLRTEN